MRITAIALPREQVCYVMLCLLLCGLGALSGRASFYLYGTLDSITQAMLSFGRKDHHQHHNMDRHRSVCRSLDVVFGLGGIIMCVSPPYLPLTP
jgi:hypothetical protein